MDVRFRAESGRHPLVTLRRSNDVCFRPLQFELRHLNIQYSAEKKLYKRCTMKRRNRVLITACYAKHKALEELTMNSRKFGVLLLVSVFATPLVWAGKLHDAAKTGDLAVVKQLIETGGNVDERDVAERTPLSWAAEGGHVEVVQFLIEKGADVDARDFTDVAPLQHAVLANNLNVVELLVKNGADVNVKDDIGVTVLDDATNRGYTEVVELLKANGAKCGTSDPYSNNCKLVGGSE